MVSYIPIITHLNLICRLLVALIQTAQLPASQVPDFQSEENNNPV